MASIDLFSHRSVITVHSIRHVSTFQILKIVCRKVPQNSVVTGNLKSQAIHRFLVALINSTVTSLMASTPYRPHFTSAAAMALKQMKHSCALSMIFVALLTLHAFATHSAARPLDDKPTNHDDEMTSAEMEKWYIRPDGAVEAEIVGADGFEGDHGGGIRWNRGEWNEGGGWDEGGNWDKGGGWSNRPPWAAPFASGK